MMEKHPKLTTEGLKKDGSRNTLLQIVLVWILDAVKILSIKHFVDGDQIFRDGDATLLAGLPDNTYWTVYASHVLEHIYNTRQAIQRWYQVLRPEGHLIINVPHRDLYEKKEMLPSQWNPDHKWFWLPEIEEPPCTKSLKYEVLGAIPEAQIVSFSLLNKDYVESGGDIGNPGGEYSIEIIVKKGAAC